MCTGMYKEGQAAMTFLGWSRKRMTFFPANGVQSSSKNFVKTIVGLWYLDGHHEKLKKQPYPVLELQALHGLQYT